MPQIDCATIENGILGSLMHLYRAVQVEKRCTMDQAKEYVRGFLDSAKDSYFPSVNEQKKQEDPGVQEI